MLIACVQSDVTFAEPAANLSRVLHWMELAAAAKSERGKKSAKLVVFPECMLTGYAFASRQQAIEAALAVDGTILQAICDSAAQHRLLVTVGFLESAEEKLYNSAALIGPQGLIGCYRKIHLPHLGVDHFVDRGDRPDSVYTAQSSPDQSPQVDAAQGITSAPRIGLAICYDASFPEPMRVLALCGADIIALGTNWPASAAHTAEIVPRARSMENHVYVVAANRVGTENGFPFCGHSSICGPDGIVLASADHQEETLLIADVDLALARNKRIQRSESDHWIDRFADRRPEHYQRIVDEKS